MTFISFIANMPRHQPAWKLSLGCNPAHMCVLQMDSAPISDERISQTIRAARVLCIYFMILVHVPPGFDSYSAVAQQSPNAPLMAQAFLTGVLGRSSVPLLSIISGYLAVASLARYGFGQYAAGRFRTLYLPTVFWNAVLLLFGFTAFTMLGVTTSSYEAVAQFSPFQLVYGALLTIDYSGITVALRFLRDLFVCGLLLPLMLWPARRAPFSSLLVLLVVSSMGVLEPLIYRPSILQFFYLGVVLRFNQHLLTTIIRHTVLFNAALVAVSVVFFLQFFAVIDPRAFVLGPTDVFATVKQFVVASAMWCFCFWLSARPAARQITRFEKTTFLTYLSHVFVFGIAWFIWQRLVSSSPTDFIYAVFFFGAPLVLMFAAQAVDPWLARLPAGLQIIVKGKAARRSPQSPRSTHAPLAPTDVAEPELAPPER